MPQIPPQTMVAVARQVRSELEALLLYPGMRDALAAVNVHYFGELTPSQPKIVRKLEEQAREMSALKNRFRENFEFFPTPRFRAELSKELREAKKSFRDGDRREQLEAQQTAIDEIASIEGKSELLLRADSTISEAWRKAIFQVAYPLSPNAMQDMIAEWGAGERLGHNANSALRVAHLGDTQINAGPTTPSRGL